MTSSSSANSLTRPSLVIASNYIVSIPPAIADCVCRATIVGVIVDMQLCAFSDVFGAARTGVHSIRLFDVAVVDVVLTLVAAYYLAVRYRQSYWVVLILLLAAGVAAHRLFCVKARIL